MNNTSIINNLDENDDNDWAIPSDVKYNPPNFFLNYESELLLWDFFLKQSLNLSKEEKKLLDQIALHGIPKEHRKQAYLLLTNSLNTLEEIPKVNNMTQDEIDASKTQIHNDIERTYKLMNWMKNEENRKRAEEVLNLLVMSNENISYTQGMNYFSPLIVSIMDNTEAFWTLYHLFQDKIHDQAFIMNRSMEGLMFHNKMHEIFLKACNPFVFNKFESMSIDPIIYTPQWILSAGLGPAMPSSLIYLILDRYIYFGQRSTHSLLLAVIQTQQQIILNAKVSKEIYEALNKIGYLFYQIDLDEFVSIWNDLMISKDDYNAVLNVVSKKDI